MTHAHRPKGDSLTINQIIQYDRDRTRCTCGHLNLSHGYPESNRDGSISSGYYSKWPDGSRIGMGACGYDRDTRNALTGWIGDPCPCSAFTEQEVTA
jgi:hypothetical protein